jgi:hypothetical protein
MKNLLTGALIGAVVAAVIAGTVWSATSLMYLSGAVTVGHMLTAADTTGGVQDGGTVPARPFTLTWGPGQNLSAAQLPLGVATNGATVVSAWCAVGNINNGAAATLALWYAASGTALGSGTQINTPASNCNANGTVNVTQNMGVTNASIPAGAVFGVVATGFTTSSAGSGVVHIVVQ